jgi:hypothetical protein
MGWIKCARCEKFWRDFVVRSFALIAPVQPVLHRVSCSNEMVPNAPKLYETQQNMSLGSNGVDRVRSLWKLWRDFVAWTFALIAPVQPVLHRDYCRNKTIPNAPGHYETRQKLSLGSYGLDRVCSLWKILTQLRGTNFCINCTNSAHFAPSFLQSQNGPKCTQTLWNATKHVIRIQCSGSGAFITNNSDMTSWH